MGRPGISFIRAAWRRFEDSPAADVIGVAALFVTVFVVSSLQVLQ